MASASARPMTPRRMATRAATPSATSRARSVASPCPLAPLARVARVAEPSGAWGAMRPASAGKDSTAGHWEIAGLHLERPFPTYPNGFPVEVLDAFSAATGRVVIGNVAASGTEIIERLGAEHERTGKWIVYTSADSVFQVAAHERVVPLEELY